MVKDRLAGKLAVILHADIAGSTQMVQLDEHLAHERIQDTFSRFSATIKEYSGKVLELRGDALLAEFERPSDAVSATLGFQSSQFEYLSSLDDDLKPEVRVGIAMGEVQVADNTITGAGVVMAQRVEQLADTGGLCITTAVRESLSGRLSVKFENLGQQELKGFEEPVGVYKVTLSDDAVIPLPEPKGVSVQSNTPWIHIGVLTIVLLMTVAGIVYWVNSKEAFEEPASIERMAFPPPDKPSIAVLPFTNMSDDTEQEYFADGMTDDLITDLSKLSNLLVIARNSSFTYKGKNVDVREIAQKLNVRYVLEGSVRRSEGTVRINAQLIDTETGGHLWAERYDGTLENIFVLQDGITQKIVSALTVELTADERENLKSMDTENLQAYEYFLKGREHFFRYSKDGMMEARELLGRSIVLDSNFAHAYALLAWTYWFEFSNGWTHDPESTLDHAEALATTAINLNSELPVAYFVTALVYRERRDYVKAVVEAEKAIRVDPNYANGRVALATVLYYTGRAEEGLEQIREAMKLEPHSTHNYLWHLGQAYFILNRYEEAITAFEEGLQKNPTSERLRLWLAAAYAQMGQIDDASLELEEVLLSNPGLTRSHIADAYPFYYFGDLSHFLDALAKAGLD